MSEVGESANLRSLSVVAYGNSKTRESGGEDRILLARSLPTTAVMRSRAKVGQSSLLVLMRRQARSGLLIRFESSSLNCLANRSG